MARIRRSAIERAVEIHARPRELGGHGLGHAAVELCEPHPELVRTDAHEIGRAIEAAVKGGNYGVVREFIGHGIGDQFHTSLQIPHYYQASARTVIEEGMTFTIEPMINAGSAGTRLMPDGWTVVTRDRSLSAQFEHSVGVTETGCEIFTLSPKGLHCPPYKA